MSYSFMKKRYSSKLMPFFYQTLCIACISPSLWAGHIYTYKDNSGSFLLTNHQQTGANLTKINATYYPDSNIHKYQNWGKSEAAVLPSFNKNKNSFDQIIQFAAQKHGISEGLIKAVMHTESGFNTNAKSPVGAQGLMQLMPATAKRFNVFNAYDPEQNIHGGAQYLSFLLKRFKGNTHLALAAYNAGEGNVQKYGGIPPFRETQDYVQRVLNRYNHLYQGTLDLNPTTMVASTQTIEHASNAPASTLAITTQTTAKKVSGKKIREIIQLADGTFTDAVQRSY